MHKLNKITFHWILLSLVFGISHNLKAQCNSADLCSDISIENTLISLPTDSNCEAFELAFISNCLESATEESDIMTCAANDNPTVWIKVEADTASYLDLAVESPW